MAEIFNEEDFADSPQPSSEAKLGGLDYLLKAAGYAGQVANMANPSYMGASVVASGGRRANRAIQRGIGSAVEAAGELGGEGLGKAAAVAGTGLGTLAEYAIPQNEIGVLGAGLGASKLLGAADEAASLAARASGKAPMLKPGRMDRTMGQAVSARSAVRPDYASEAIADPSILSEQTLSKSKVSPMYQAFMEKMNAKIGPEKLKALSGSRYPAGENEVGRLERMVEDTLARIDKGEKVPIEDAFLARQAASRLTASEKAMRMPSMRRMAAQDESKLSDYLESVGGGELKDLNRLWRRASIKEAFGHALPQNKNMSPNALRSFAMGEQFLRAGESLAEGRPVQAAFRAGSAITMSPFVMGEAIKGARPGIRAAGYQSLNTSHLFGNEGDEEIGSQRRR